MTSQAVVVVSQDPAGCDSIRELLESAGLQAETFSSLRAFLNAVGPGRRRCLVVDSSGDLGSPERQSEIAECCALTAVVFITERGNVAASVRAVKAGATEVVEKPYRGNGLLGSINKALAANAPADG